MNKEGKMRIAFVMMVIGLFLISIFLSFVSAEITSAISNLNGQNRWSISNYTSISGIGNLSVGQGNLSVDIYSNGTKVIVNSTGLGLHFTDGIVWTELNTFPVACPTGSFLTQLGSSVTCTALTTITNNANITGNFTVAQSIIFLNSTGSAKWRMYVNDSGSLITESM